MTRTRNLLHATKTHSKGDWDNGVPADSHLGIKLLSPGTPGNAPNPEQFFAAGWSACFGGAVRIATRKTGDAYFLRARLNISLASLER